MNGNRILLLDLDKHVSPLKFLHRELRGPRVGINSIYECVEELQIVRGFDPKWVNENIWIPAGKLNSAKNLPKVPSNHCQIIYGPNIHVEDMSNIPYLNNSAVTFLVPSEWVVDVARKYLNLANIVVFPYGIKIPNFREYLKANEILIYVKGTKDRHKLEGEIAIVETFSKSSGATIRIFEYGKYKKSNFTRALERAKFGVWLGQAESQGLALMEAWSYDVPTLVRRSESWMAHDGEIFKAQSAPYLNSQRGEYTKTESLTLTDLENFACKVIEFNPRQSLVGDLDYGATALKFKNLFENS